MGRSCGGRRKAPKGPAGEMFDSQLLKITSPHPQNSILAQICLHYPRVCCCLAPGSGPPQRHGENITGGVSESAGIRSSVNFISTVNPSALSCYLWSPECRNCWIYCLWLLHYLFKMQSKPLCLLHYLRQILLLSSLARALTLFHHVCVSNNSPQVFFSSHPLLFGSAVEA